MPGRPAMNDTPETFDAASASIAVTAAASGSFGSTSSMKPPPDHRDAARCDRGNRGRQLGHARRRRQGVIGISWSGDAEAMLAGGDLDRVVDDRRLVIARFGGAERELAGLPRGFCNLKRDAGWLRRTCDL